MTRYSLRFGTSRIPTVEVIDPTLRNTTWSPNIVKRVHGWTNQHAYRRALAWVRQNGDPR